MTQGVTQGLGGCNFAYNLDTTLATLSVKNNNLDLSAATTSLPVTTVQPCEGGPAGMCSNDPPVTCPAKVTISLSGNDTNGYSISIDQQ